VVGGTDERRSNDPGGRRGALDLELSGCDGAELCRQIRKHPDLAWTPVVIAIGSRSPAEHARAIRAGATDVLTKPLSESALLESVSRLTHTDRPQGRPRVEVAAPVQIDGASAWGTLRNLSRGGAFVETPSPIASNREVRLDFRVPGSRRAVHPTARVVWSRRSTTQDRPVGQGLQFLDVDRASLSAIEQFVGEQIPSPAVHSGGV